MWKTDMNWILGILFLLLVQTTQSTTTDVLQWKSTQPAPTAALPDTLMQTEASILGSPSGTSLEASLSASVGTAEAPATAARETSLRSPDAMEEEAPDYYDDETYETASGEDGQCAASDRMQVPESATEYELPDYDDDETREEVSGGDGPHPASDNAPVAEGASSVDTHGRSDDASRRKNTAPSRSSGATGWEGQLRIRIAPPEPGAPPEVVNMISWLPAWCSCWPPFGPLAIPRNTLLQAFAEALAEYTAGIVSYWEQPRDSADTEQPSTEEPQTNYVSTLMKQVASLHEFYKWMYHQLTSIEATGDSIPRTLYLFLDAIEEQATLVQSLCNWSPTARITCHDPDADILRKYFWIMDRLLIWVQTLRRWAATEYNLVEQPGIHPLMWLSSNLDHAIPAFNVSRSSQSRQTAGDSASYVEAVSNSVCTTQETRGERDLTTDTENFEELSAEAMAPRNACSSRQSQKPHKQNGKFSSCVLQSILMREHESGQSLGMEMLPFRVPEIGMSLEAGDGLEDLIADESFYDDVPQLQQMGERTVVEEQGEEQDPEPRNLARCSENHMLKELGSEFDPTFVSYVKCNEQDEACKLPERCLPVSSLLTVEMPRWVRLPEFPHSFVHARALPSGRIQLMLSVDTSCKCVEPVETH